MNSKFAASFLRSTSLLLTLTKKPVAATLLKTGDRPFKTGDRAARGRY